MDSHADSPVVVIHAYVTSHTGKTDSVVGFMKTIGTCNTIPIINSDVIYYCESMGRSIILSIHNSLYFKGMNHNLISPFIMRLASLEVENVLSFLPATQQ